MIGYAGEYGIYASNTESIEIKNSRFNCADYNLAFEDCKQINLVALMLDNANREQSNGHTTVDDVLTAFSEGQRKIRNRNNNSLSDSCIHETRRGRDKIFHA